MTPQPNKVQELEDRIVMLESIIRTLNSAPEMSPDVKRTITAILSGTSTKTALSATRTVNEAGAGTYSVMYPPTGFINIGGYDVPYI